MSPAMHVLETHSAVPEELALVSGAQGITPGGPDLGLLLLLLVEKEGDILRDVISSFVYFFLVVVR